MAWFQKKHVCKWSSWRDYGIVRGLGTTIILGIVQQRRCDECNKVEFETRSHELLKEFDLINPATKEETEAQ